MPPSMPPSTPPSTGESAGLPSTPSGLCVREAKPCPGCQRFFWHRSLWNSGKLAESFLQQPSHHRPRLCVPEPAQYPGGPLLAGSLPPAGCSREGQQAFARRRTPPCVQDPSRSLAAAAVKLSRAMQDVWRWPATGGSVWEKSCLHGALPACGRDHTGALLSSPSQPRGTWKEQHSFSICPWAAFLLQGCSIIPQNMEGAVQPLAGGWGSCASDAGCWEWVRCRSGA